MNKSLFVVMVLALSTCEPDSPTYAQSCNPAVVNYTVSEESGQVLSAPELKVVHERLPLPTSSVLAQEYIIRRLRFLRGRISTTARGRVVGARTAHEYLFRARAGQRITVRIESTESKAMFSIDPRDGRFPLRNGVAEGRDDGVAQDVTFWSGAIPESADYSIVISTDGTTTYKLEVTIR
jgi:hypothetical protein